MSCGVAQPWSPEGLSSTISVCMTRCHYCYEIFKQRALGNAWPPDESIRSLHIMWVVTYCRRKSSLFRPQYWRTLFRSFCWSLVPRSWQSAAHWQEKFLRESWKIVCLTWDGVIDFFSKGAAKHRGSIRAIHPAVPGSVLGDPENLFRTKIYRMTLLSQWTMSIEWTHPALMH